MRDRAKALGIWVVVTLALVVFLILRAVVILVKIAAGKKWRHE